MRFSQVKVFSKVAIIDWVAIHLYVGDKVISDDLNCLHALDEAGFDHKVIITGGGPESVKITEFKWVNMIIGNVNKSLHGTFHAVSKKHFPRYLAEFCYRFNCRFDLRQLIPRFSYIALKTPSILQRLLKVAVLCG